MISNHIQLKILIYLSIKYGLAHSSSRKALCIATHLPASRRPYFPAGYDDSGMTKEALYGCSSRNYVVGMRPVVGG